MNLYKLLIVLVCTVILSPSLVNAHPGGTDESGGHYCWTNCEAYNLRVGEYHFHDTE